MEGSSNQLNRVNRLNSVNAIYFFRSKVDVDFKI